MTNQTQPLPLASERRAHVLDALARHGTVRVSQLIADLGVSPVTLRRDLAQMEERGLLRRVHGGAVATEGTMAVENRPGGRTGAGPGSIAVLVPSLSYYWPGVVRGIEAEAQRKGVRLLLRGASYELQDERPVLERLIATEDVRGMIVAPNTDTPHAQDVIQWLHRSDIPSVLVERDAIVLPDRQPVASVTTDHSWGAVLAVEHLAELGHTRLGLMLSRHSPTSRKISAGWHDACRRLGLSPDSGIEQVLPDRTSAGFLDGVNRALDAVLDNGITGVLIHSDPEAMAIVDLAQNRGISVPDDLSVVAYDDEVADLCSPPLTAVSPPRKAVGEAALELLTKYMVTPDLETRRILLNPSLVVRQSTAAAPIR